MPTRQMTEDGTSVHLTRKENDLLCLLAQNAGRILSRRFLLETVWGYNPRVITRTLDVHIGRLRRKLAAEQDVRIHTVCGRGYILQRPPQQARGAPDEALFQDGLNAQP